MSALERIATIAARYLAHLARQEKTMTDQIPTFDEHAIVELLGHRRVAGRVREVQIAGAGFLRIDIPATDGHTEQTQYVSPGSVYALHPTTEDIATAVAARCRPEPAHRWELPALAVSKNDDERLPYADFDEPGPF